jgi:hypothetical protein
MLIFKLIQVLRTWELDQVLVGALIIPTIQFLLYRWVVEETLQDKIIHYLIYTGHLQKSHNQTLTIKYLAIVAQLVYSQVLQIDKF